MQLVERGWTLQASVDSDAGAHGGFPLHHAAKRGLDKTVLLLLSRGGRWSCPFTCGFNICVMMISEDWHLVGER